MSPPVTFDLQLGLGSSVMPWSHASLNQEGSLGAERWDELAGEPLGILPFRPNSHLIQHMGYGESAAQVLGAGTGRWNLERLQLKGAGRGNMKIQDLKHFFCRHFTGLGGHQPAAPLHQLCGGVASTHLGRRGRGPISPSRTNPAMPVQVRALPESPGPHC